MAERRAPGNARHLCDLHKCELPPENFFANSRKGGGGNARVPVAVKAK